MQEHSLSAGDIFGIIGHEGFRQLVTGFYERVENDDILRPMYPKGDLEPAAERLQLFLEQYFGGPTTYMQKRGHPRLRARHMRFPIDEAARDRWVELMLSALDDADFAPEVQAIMQDYFENGATFLINRSPFAGGMFATLPPSEEHE